MQNREQEISYWEHRLETVNQDENPIEREAKLNQLYEEMAEFEALKDEDEPRATAQQ